VEGNFYVLMTLFWNWLRHTAYECLCDVRNKINQYLDTYEEANRTCKRKARKDKIQIASSNLGSTNFVLKWKFNRRKMSS